MVVVPFPFSDRATTKRRPAVVLSAAAFNRKAGHSVLAMITSATESAWPQDVAVEDLKTAGLTVACCVRFKLFTLDNRLVLRKAGRLSKVDAAATETAIRMVFGSGR